MISEDSKKGPKKAKKDLLVYEREVYKLKRD